MQNKHIIRPTIGTGLILLIPLAAMQFTSELDWDLTDFLVMGILLFGTGLALEFAAKKLSNSVHRIIAIIAIVLALLLIWAELAVGIFSTPFAGS